MLLHVAAVRPRSRRGSSSQSPGALLPVAGVFPYSRRGSSSLLRARNGRGISFTLVLVLGPRSEQRTGDISVALPAVSQVCAIIAQHVPVLACAPQEVKEPCH